MFRDEGDFPSCKQFNLISNREIKRFLIEKNTLKVYDCIIDKLGVTRYTIKILATVIMFMISDGSQMIMTSLITSRLESEWGLTTSQKGLLGSSIFIGFFLGVIASEKISDLEGRKPILLIGSLIVSIFSFLSAFAYSYLNLLLFRTVCGFGMGLCFPSTFSLAVEATPTVYRQWLIIVVWVFFPSGEIITILLSHYFLQLDEGWRNVLGYSSLPCLFTFFLSLGIWESPKFLLFNKQYYRGFKGIQRMIKYSKIKIHLSKELKDHLIKEIAETQINKANEDFSILISYNFIKLSLMLCSIFFSISFIYYGLIYILPQVIEVENSPSIENIQLDPENIYLGLIISVLSEIPGVVLSGYLANYPLICRVKSIAIGFGISFLSLLGCFFFSSYLVFYASIVKFVIYFPFNIIVFYTYEAYPQRIHSTAIGVCNYITRFAAIISPMITQTLFNINYKLPFFIYSVSALIGFICTIWLPIGTKNRIFN